MITANFSGEKIYSTSNEAFNLFEKSYFGEKIQNKVEYSFIEALYLIQLKKMEIYQNSKRISDETFLKKIKRFDKKIETKLTVFSDLRRKGYIVKTALKYGAEFRVYQKGSKPGKSHSPWILYTSKESDNLKIQDFAAKNRVAHSTKKKLLMAVVDEESDVTYYEVSWIRT